MIEEVFEYYLNKLNSHIRECLQCQNSQDDENCCEIGKELIKNLKDFNTGEG